MTMSRSSAQSPLGLREAFSLVEMLLVLAILGVVTALTVPAIDHWQRAQQLQAAVDLVRSELLDARRTAIDTGRSVAFEYQPGSGRYAVREESADRVHEGQLAESVRFGLLSAPRQQSWPALWFHPNGTAVDHSVPVSDDVGRTQHLVVRRLTGGVIVE